MGKVKEPQPARLFMSLIMREVEVLEKGLEVLRANYGEIDFVSDRFPFNFTDYYAEEMGRGLFRHLISFQTPVPMTALPDIKRATNRLEETLSTGDGARRINIDPGYITLQHVVLATTKAYGHRPYLRDGIYADVTLIYRNKSFQPLEWTYPDYRQEGMILLFNHLRTKIAETLKRGGHHPC